MKGKETLKSVYLGYLEERKKYFTERWSKFSSFYNRMFGDEKEFIELLSEERPFQEKLYEWVSGHISANELELKDVKGCRLSIKLFVEEMRGRNTFLIVFITLVTISFSLSNLFSASQSVNAGLAILNGLVGILVLVERGNISKHIGYCNQLDSLFEKWIDRNGQ